MKRLLAALLVALVLIAIPASAGAWPVDQRLGRPVSKCSTRLLPPPYGCLPVGR